MGSGRVTRTTRELLTVALLAALTALAFALLGAEGAEGKRARVIAKPSSGDPARLRVRTRAPHSSRRVSYFIDGRRQWVDRSYRWRFGRSGYLNARRVKPGRHRIKTKVILHDGRSKSSSVVRFLRRGGSGKGSWSKKPAPDLEPQPEPALIDAGFENGLAGWNVGGVGDVEPSIVSDIVDSGSKSGRVVLSGSQDRSELVLDEAASSDGRDWNPVSFEEGSEYHYGFSFNVLQMQYGRPGAHNLIMQFKSDGTGSPAFGLQLWDYAGDGGSGGGRGLWSHGSAMGGDRFLAPISHGRWYRVAIHFKASRHENGFYRLYLDGQLIDSRDGVSLIRPNRSSAYIKNGLYRNGDQIPGGSEIRLDSATLGTSAKQVG